MGSTELRQLLIYPPGKGGIAINTEDYLCLAQDQFLNDVIIDFYLKYVATTVIKSSMHDKVYIFSSFFYKRLTTKPAKAPKRPVTYETDPSLSAAEKRHARVKNWTKHVNIFEKDFIIIPINENSHWFLAIICYPGLDGCRSMIDEEKVVKIPGKKVKKKKEEKKLDNIITIGNTTITIKTHADEKVAGDKPIKCEEDEASDRDEAEGDESELEEEDTDSDMEDIQLGKKKPVREPIKQACILIFDSLSGAGRSRVVATLRDYLTCEYKAKMHTEKLFTKDVIKGACPKVPQQTNFTDCGLYVLQYVEAFFKDPIKDFHIPIKQLKNWFEEIVVTRKREDISNLIKELMVLHGKDTKILPDIAFPTVNGELVNSGESSFVDPEDDYTEMPGPEEQETSSPEKMETSLVGDLYNSDSSGESSNKQSEANVHTEETSPTSFEAGSIKGILKGGLLDFQKKSNRDTMSYLKSKRISRHKNNESTNELKKQKLDD